MKKLLGPIIAFFCFVRVWLRAFDTGPHFDLTSAVLSERGFGETAIKIAQVENWLTDYYYSRDPYFARCRARRSGEAPLR